MLLPRLVTRLKLAKELRKTKYDVTISLTPSQSKQSLLALAVGANIKVGFRDGWWHNWIFDEMVDINQHMHEVDWYLTLAGKLGAKSAGRKPEIVLQDEHVRFAERTLPRWENRCIIGIHPGCGDAQAYKRWPPDRFASVADHLVQHYDAHVVLFGGPNEVSLTESIRSIMREAEVTVLTGRMSLLEAAACMTRCDLFISNDSGLMHLAAAVGTPVVAIFGPTSESKNAPLGSTSIIVRKGDCSAALSNAICPPGVELL